MANLCERFAPTYPVTRALRHPRLLWCLIIPGGVCLGTLFAFIAVATNGYEMTPLYTSDPNTTESAKKWFQHAPFATFGSPETSCQPALLSIKDNFMTTNYGYVYSLSGMQTLSPNSASQSIRQRLTQVPYRDSPLTDCRVDRLFLNFARMIQDDDQGQWWTWAESSAEASVQCTIFSSNDRSPSVRANFTLALPPPETLPRIEKEYLVDSFASQTRAELETMFYGVLLTSEWYHLLVGTMGYSRPHSRNDSADSWSHGQVVLLRNANVTNYRSADFFLIYAGFETRHGLLATSGPNWTMAEWHTRGRRDPYYLPNISVSVDTFAKSFYSLLATDFGIVDDSNALKSRSGIEYLRDIVDPFAADGYETCTSRVHANFCSKGGIAAFRISNHTKLAISPQPRLITQYLCSVPTQKTAASVTYAVVIAELVFLRAVWAAFCLLAGWILNRNDPRSDHCAGCMKAADNGAFEGVVSCSSSTSIHSSSAERKPDCALAWHHSILLRRVSV